MNAINPPSNVVMNRKCNELLENTINNLSMPLNNWLKQWISWKLQKVPHRFKRMSTNAKHAKHHKQLTMKMHVRHLRSRMDHTATTKQRIYYFLGCFAARRFARQVCSSSFCLFALKRVKATSGQGDYNLHKHRVWDSGWVVCGYMADHSLKNGGRPFENRIVSTCFDFQG